MNALTQLPDDLLGTVSLLHRRVLSGHGADGILS